ncbi:MAG: RCC1 domain-containing protein [Planctomycetota bacterium]
MKARLIPIAAAIAASLAAHELRCQSYVQGFGLHVFDTSLVDATDFVMVRSGDGHTLALRGNGSVVGFGDEPVANVPQFALPATEVDTGIGLCALALFVDGSITAWGRTNFFGELNVPALPAGMTYLDCAIFSQTGAAVRSDGQMITWGYNGYGLTSPPQPPAGTSYLTVSAGYNYFAALRSDGQVVAWGSNSLGQLNTPSPPPGVSYVAVDCGEAHGLALRSDGLIDAWGWPANGALNVPPLPPGITYTATGGGWGRSLAIRSDGSVVGWGDNTFGLLNVPALPAGVTAVQVSLEFASAHMVRSDGKIVTWGAQVFGSEFGKNFPAASPGPAPTHIDSGEDGAVVLFEDGTVVSSAKLPDLPALPAGVTYETISSEYDRIAAVRSDGLVEVVSNSVPLTTLPSGVSYVDADVAYSGLVGLRSDGQVETTGSAQALPAPPAGLGYVQIEAGNTLSSGLLSNGEVVTQGSLLVPVPPLPPGLQYIGLSSTINFGHCLRSDGTIVTWGQAYGNPTGQAPQGAPPLPPGVTYVEVATGRNHSVARRSDGTIVAWESQPQLPTSLWNGSLIPTTTTAPNATYNSVGAGTRSTTAVIGPKSTFVTFATGCSGSLPSTRIIPEDTPRVGEDFVVRLFDLPAGVAILTMGFSNTVATFGPLPQSAAPLGMPGCTIQISPDFSELVGSVGASEPAVFTLPIPNNLALLGTTFYQQALVPDAGANAAGFVISDAAEGVVGR